MIYNAIHGPAKFLSKLNLPDAPQCRFIYEHGSTIEQREAGVIFPQVPCWYRDGDGRYHQRRGGLFYLENLEDWLRELSEALAWATDMPPLSWSSGNDICILNIESPGVRAESRPATMRAILAERCCHYGIEVDELRSYPLQQRSEMMKEGIRLYNEAAPRWYEGIARACREWFSGVGYYNVLPNPGTTVDRVIAASDFVAPAIYEHTYEEAASKIARAKDGNHGKKVYAVVCPRFVAKGANLSDQVFEAMVAGADGVIVWDSVFKPEHVKAYTRAMLKQVHTVLEKQ